MGTKNETACKGINIIVLKSLTINKSFVPFASCRLDRNY